MHGSSRYVKWVPSFSAHFQHRDTTLPTVDRDEISRRLRAARALAVPTEDELAARKRPVVGITVEELAARVGQDGLGAKTIGNMERGDGPALKPQLREIAEACGVPYAFFTADLVMLEEVPVTGETLRAQLDRHERLLREITASLPTAGQEGLPTPPPEVEPRAGNGRSAPPPRNQKRRGA
jgi:transcriptional regulator with XRE-family HTH domain